MTLDLSLIFAFILTGFVVGALIGATGVGGGSLMTPILVLLFGVSPATAVGTDLLFAAVTKGAGTALHGMNRSISWRVVGRLCAGSVPASLVTVWLLRDVFAGHGTDSVIMTALGIALLLTSLAILGQPLIRRFVRKGKSPSSFPAAHEGGPNQRDLVAQEARCERRPRAAAFTVLVGAVLGTVVTLTSVGAGALGVMVLMALYPHVRSVRIIGTDIAHAVPLTLIAGMGHASLGGVDFALLGALVSGSIPGIAIGAQLAFRLPERVTKQLLGVILLGVGSKLVFAA